MTAFVLRTMLSCFLISLLAGCTAAPTIVPTVSVPTQIVPTDPPPAATATTSAPTATLAPTETPLPEPTATAAPTETTLPEPTSAAAARSDGWMVYEMREDGYSIALPPSWSRFDLDPQSLSSAMEKVTEKNQDFSKMLNQQMQTIMAAGVKFYGVDLSDESIQSGFITNINILVAPIAAEVDLAMIAQLNVDQIQTLPGVVKPVNHSAVKLPGGEAQRLSYKMNMTTAAGEETTAAFTQYIFLKGKMMYLITLTTRADLLPGYSPDFEKIAQGFEFSE